VDFVNAGTGTEMNLGGTPVEAGDAVGPEPVQQVCVVAVTKENLGVGPGESGVQMRDDSDLVITADGGEDGPDAWITEGRVEISGTVFSGCGELAGIPRAPGQSRRRTASSPARELQARSREQRMRVTESPPDHPYEVSVPVRWIPIFASRHSSTRENATTQRFSGGISRAGAIWRAR
jgi:hypothetical protein